MEPCRVLIVDDEPPVRLLLEKKVRWEENGFQVIGCAQNGREALEALDKRAGRCDVVLTDLNMPEMDGFALIGEVEKRYPSVACVALSVLSDHRSVREAFRRGAVDYMLKYELEESYVAGVLRRAVRAKRFVGAGERLTLAFSSAVGGGAVEEILRERYDGTPMVLCAGRFLGAEAGAGECLRACEGALEEFAQSLRAVSGREALLLLCLDPVLCRSGAYVRQLAQMARSARAAAGGRLCLGASRVFYRADGIPGALKEARTALDGAYFDGSAQLIFSAEGGNAPFRPPDPEKTARALCEAALSDAGETQALKTVRQAFSGCGADQRADAQRFFGAVRAALARQLAAEGFSPQTAGIAETEYGCATLGEELARLEEAVKRLRAACALESQDRNQRLIGKAVGYAEAHYSQKLTLQELADVVGLSPSYFSHLFVAVRGETLSAFLTRVRVDSARRMLVREPDRKVYEVALQCGFSSTEHFSRTFKKETGMSPIRFRIVSSIDKHRKRQEE